MEGGVLGGRGAKMQERWGGGLACAKGGDREGLNFKRGGGSLVRGGRRGGSNFKRGGGSLV